MPQTDYTLLVMKEVIESMQSSGEINILKQALKDANVNHDNAISLSELKVALKGIRPFDARYKRFDAEGAHNTEAANYWHKKEVLAFFLESLKDCAGSLGLKEPPPWPVAEIFASTYSLKKANTYLQSQGLLPVDSNFLIDYIKDCRAQKDPSKAQTR